MSNFTLSVSMCAGVSGSRPRREYMAPSTAADPHVRGHPPRNVEYGMYFAQCVCVCVCIRCDVGCSNHEEVDSCNRTVIECTSLCYAAGIFHPRRFNALYNCFDCESLAVTPCHAPPAEFSETVY